MPRTGNQRAIALAIILIIHCGQSLDLRPRGHISNLTRQARQYDSVGIESSMDIVDAVVIKAVEIPEERVTYEGAQLWRVLADGEQADFVSYLQETGGEFCCN